MKSKQFENDESFYSRNRVVAPEIINHHCRFAGQTVNEITMAKAANTATNDADEPLNPASTEIEARERMEAVLPTIPITARPRIVRMM